MPYRRYLSSLICLLIGVYIGTLLKPNQKEPTIPTAGALSKMTFGDAPNKPTNPRAVPREIIPHPTQEDLRHAQVDQRETSAPIDARKIMERRRDEYWTELKNLGMSYADFERLIGDLSNTLALSFIAEDALVQQISSQNQIVAFLHNTLTADAVAKFRTFELGRAARESVDEVRQLATKQQIDMSEEDSAIMQQTLLNSGILPKTFGGLFDSVNVPLVGLEAAETRRREELDHFEKASGEMLRQLSSTIPENLLDILKADLDSRNTELRIPVPTPEEAELRLERIMAQSMERFKAKQPPPKP